MPVPSTGPVLITGASSGIGKALAAEFAKDGHPLVLVARGREALEAAAAELRSAHGVTVHALALDCGEPFAAEILMAELGQRRLLELDVLVNNAGFGTLSPFAEGSPDGDRAMIALNLDFLVRMTHLVLPGMLAHGHGRVLNVASTAAFQPGPFMAVYYASKAFVLSFSLALAEELRGRGVTVTALCPGPVRTGFQSRAGLQGAALMQGPFVVDVARVAREGHRACMAGRRVVVPGWLNALAAFGTRFAPRTLSTRIVRRLQGQRFGDAKKR